MLPFPASKAQAGLSHVWAVGELPRICLASRDGAGPCGQGFSYKESGFLLWFYETHSTNSSWPLCFEKRLEVAQQRIVQVLAEWFASSITRRMFLSLTLSPKVTQSPQDEILSGMEVYAEDGRVMLSLCLLRVPDLPELYGKVIFQL